MSRLTWPRLSESLPYAEPSACQNCEDAQRLTYWRECDERDRPTTRIIVLCSKCADRVIEPHPRLYRQLPKNSPMPGLMPVCLDCVHRVGSECLCPDSISNGGKGIYFHPPPARVHLNCGRKSPLSGWHWMLNGPVEKCSGKS